MGEKKSTSVVQTQHDAVDKAEGFTHLYFEFLYFFFNLDQVLRLSHRSLPHAVREQGEQTLHHLEERNGRTVQHSDLLNSLYIYSSLILKYLNI